MPKNRPFTVFSNEIESVVERLSRHCGDDDWPALVAAIAFHLQCVLSAMPDDFWVTPVTDPRNVSDADLHSEEAWNEALDRLFRSYIVSPRP